MLSEFVCLSPLILPNAFTSDFARFLYLSFCPWPLSLLVIAVFSRFAIAVFSHLAITFIFCFVVAFSVLWDCILR